MTEQAPNREADRADRGDPIDRRTSDGAAGEGDMLGGLSTGAGGRLGPDQGIERGGVTLPTSGDGPAYEGQTVPMAEVPGPEEGEEEEWRSSGGRGERGAGRGGDVRVAPTDWSPGVMDEAAYDDDPARVRDRLARPPRGDWFVFETFAANGSLAVGVTKGEPDPAAVLVVYADLPEEVAKAAARGLARWHRRQGRAIAMPSSSAAGSRDAVAPPGRAWRRLSSRRRR